MIETSQVSLKLEKLDRWRRPVWSSKHVLQVRIRAMGDVPTSNLKQQLRAQVQSKLQPSCNFKNSPRGDSCGQLLSLAIVVACALWLSRRRENVTLERLLSE